MSNKNQKKDLNNLLEDTPCSSDSESSKEQHKKSAPVPNKHEEHKKKDNATKHAPSKHEGKKEEKKEHKKEEKKEHKKEEKKEEKKEVKKEEKKEEKKEHKKEEKREHKKEEKKEEKKKPEHEETKLGKRDAVKQEKTAPAKTAPKKEEKVCEVSSDSSSDESEDEKPKKTSKKDNKKKSVSPISSKKVSFHEPEKSEDKPNKKIKTHSKTKKPESVEKKEEPKKHDSKAKPVEDKHSKKAKLAKKLESSSSESESEAMEIEKSDNSESGSESESESESDKMEIEEKPKVVRKESADKTKRKESTEKAKRKESTEKPQTLRKASAEKVVKAEIPEANAPRQNNGQGNQFGNGFQQNNDRKFGQEYEVIVCGLPFTSSEQDIKSHFSECPNLKFVKMMMGQDGRSRGKCFVKFASEEGMTKALELNGSNVGGRTIIVEITDKTKGGNQPNTGGMGQRQPFNSNNGNAEGGEQQESMSVLVRNLAYTVDEMKLQNVFSGCGTVKGARICKDDTGRSKGFGFVDFTSLDASKNALKKNNEKVDGRPIGVFYSMPRDRSAPRQNQGSFGGRGNFGGNSFANEKKGALTQFQGDAFDIED